MAERRTPKAASRPRAAGRKAPTTEIVVRRGALRRFDALKRKTVDLPVIVSWDRRQSERRGASLDVAENRRGPDRRQKPPFTWELAEFVVVAPRPPLAAPAHTPAKRPRSTAGARRR